MTTPATRRPSPARSLAREVAPRLLDVIGGVLAVKLALDVNPDGAADHPSTLRALADDLLVLASDLDTLTPVSDL